ncbi:hypothetical protein GGR53DRAFT_471260 [Hypoxylon sp. FL1150]|nr:hypothetical protein GGR53DRAFT_471260 [Hypoxylon sp. FL1150]
MASSTYTPAFPSDRAVDDKIKSYIANFYATSDDRSKNEEWVDYFLPDAVVIMGDKAAKGTQEIRQLRQGMWELVESRRHKPEKVFPATFEGTGADGDGDGVAAEYMLHGSLDLVMKTGESSAISWAGRAVLRDVDGKLKYQLYQVYMHKKLT